MDETIYEAWIEEIEENSGELIDIAVGKAVEAIIATNREDFFTNILARDEKVAREEYAPIISHIFVWEIRAHTDPGKQWYLQANLKVARRVIDWYVERDYDNDYCEFLYEVYRNITGEI